jgi:hypothetical protein
MLGVTNANHRSARVLIIYKNSVAHYWLCDSIPIVFKAASFVRIFESQARCSWTVVLVRCAASIGCLRKVGKQLWFVF